MLSRNAGELYVDDIPLSTIAAQFGTPTYVYSLSALKQRFNAYKATLAPHNALICYAVKANSNLSILSSFHRLGSGFDIVSGGELARVLAAGGDPAKIVFSGVGKTRAEIHAALQAKIRCFNIESESELTRLQQAAEKLNVTAPIAFRVNPDVDPKTHPYISTGLKNNKFGVPIAEAVQLYQSAQQMTHISIEGVACHIGSQLLDSMPMVEAAQKLITLSDTLTSQGIVLRHIDLGGGMGIQYHDEKLPSVAEFLAPVLACFKDRREEISIEPGRSMIGNAGLLLTRVEHLKHTPSKNFAIVDAAMNDLPRPALYNSYHEITPIQQREQASAHYDVVGPICESGDFLAHNRELAVQEGDLLAVLSAGAYSMSMSSNYNSRPRAAEVIIDGSMVTEIRPRETIDSLMASELALLNPV